MYYKCENCFETFANEVDAKAHKCGKQPTTKMEDCPMCDGLGKMQEEFSHWVTCPLCNGFGEVTQAQSVDYMDSLVAVYEAQRRYVRELTAD